MKNVEKIDILFKDNGLEKVDSYYRINAGFNNMVFSINEKYILKICTNPNRESKFFNEIKFYTENNYSFIPEIITSDITKSKIPFYYIIQEKIQGSNLYTVWSSLTKEERKEILDNLLNYMKIIHNKEVEYVDYKNRIIEIFSYYLKLLEKDSIISRKKILYLHTLKECIIKKYNTCKMCQIHGDLQFNNIVLMPDKNIKIIDFEHCEIAPIEKEFDSLFRMSQYPHTFLQKDNNNNIDINSFLEVKQYFEDNYTEVCERTDFINNILIFEILNSIRWICKYPDYERYNEILFDKSKKLVL